MACLLRRHSWRRDPTHRQHFRHGEDRDRLQQLWRPLGTCVQGRGIPDTHGREALRELGEHKVQQGRSRVEGLGDGYEAWMSDVDDKRRRVC
jgi:hypothetical protein